MRLLGKRAYGKTVTNKNILFCTLQSSLLEDLLEREEIYKQVISLTYQQKHITRVSACTKEEMVRRSQFRVVRTGKFSLRCCGSHFQMIPRISLRRKENITTKQRWASVSQTTDKEYTPKIGATEVGTVDRLPDNPDTEIGDIT